LLIALVAIILGFIQLYYVPEIMKQKEADHMDVVENQFSHLKSVVEIQGLTGDAGDTQIAFTPISSPLTLGTNRLPYFVSTGSTGSVQVYDRNRTDSKIIIVDPHNDFSTPPSPEELPFIPLTSVKYEAYNYYYTPQTYIMEGGGIILTQSGREIMKVNPAITVKNLSKVTIYFYLPLYKSEPGKSGSISGSDDVYIRTSISNYYDTHSDTTNDYIRIYSDYLDAWNQSLNHTDTGILREYYDDLAIEMGYDNDDNPEYFYIKPKNREIHLILDVVEIDTQIGPGFVIGQ
jgi:hypothetical protein